MCWLSKLFGGSNSPKQESKTAPAQKKQFNKPKEVTREKRMPKPSQADNKYPYD